jgi:hypothetical protein
MRIPPTGVLVLVLAIVSTAFGERADTVVLQLDGYNSVAVVHQQPTPMRSIPWFTVGPTGRGYDPHGLLSAPWAADSAPLGSVKLRMGSETGDPLLNKLENPHLPNRDHEIDCWVSARVPRLSTALWGAYRYTDIWSDRFDTLWALHRGIVGRPMAGTGAEEADGLSDEKLLGYSVALENSRADGYVQTYSHWGATPYYRSPIRSTGIMTHHRARLALGQRFSCRTEILWDHGTRYLNHTIGSDIGHTVIDAEASYNLTAHAEAGVAVHHDSRYSPAAGMTVSVRSTDLGPLAAECDIGTWENGQPFGRVGLATRFTGNVMLGVHSTWDYEPGLTGIQFMHLDTSVQCVDVPRRGVGMHAAVTYHDTLGFPLIVSAWCDYRDVPYLLSKRQLSDSAVELRPVPAPDGPATSVGGAVRYEVAAGVFTARTRLAAHRTVNGGPEALSLPWNAGLDLGIRSRRRPEVLCEASLDAVGPVEQRYVLLPDRTVERLRCDPRVVLGVRGRLPVLMPLLREHLRAGLTLEVTNINLTGEIRARNHPQGNLVGPTIRVSGTGALLRPRK